MIEDFKKLIQKWREESEKNNDPDFPKSKGFAEGLWLCADDLEDILTNTLDLDN